MSKYSFFNDAVEAAGHITDVLGNLLKVNTIFVASNDGKNNRILKAFNREEMLVGEGLVLPLRDTYCSLVSGKAVYIPHTIDHPSTCQLPVTEGLGDHSFIGFPVIKQNGTLFGTVCALHAPGYVFSKPEIQALHSMAIFMSYVVELEKRIDQQSEIIEYEQERNEELHRDKQQVVERYDALQQVKDQLDLKLQHKSDTLAVLSHEIRNPLNGIASVIELLETTGLSPEQHAYIQIIKKSSHTLMDLLNNVLELSRLESGKMTVESELFDLPTLVEEAAYVFAAKALERNIELIMDIEEEIPLLYGDTRKIRQILINLISNAVKFTHAGDILIQAAVVAEDDMIVPGIALEPSVSLQISITDTGIGMEPKQLERLFERYYRAGLRESSYNGTGLGLVVCKQLIELMEGSIEVKSVPGEGSVFSFTLPVLRHELTTPSLRQPLLQDKRILLIDDNEKVQCWIGRLVDDWGMRLLATHDEQESLRLLSHPQALDAVLIDYEWMKLQPESVQATLRQLKTSRGVAVILLASLGTMIDDAARDWSTGVVVKPMRRMYLLNALIFALTNQTDPTSKLV
ncbi:ATP-binding protein [Paenibacillus sp. SGZ-1009]|uniref:ATP-binding protein n=1 Tax=Paenibacillus campi TaxID=3106031 RepID=UPI002AFE0EC9|nr:ATP-binding protein [Paenibacillus sp. SGZ-1009]